MRLSHEPHHNFWTRQIALCSLRFGTIPNSRHRSYSGRLLLGMSSQTVHPLLCLMKVRWIVGEDLPLWSAKAILSATGRFPRIYPLYNAMIPRMHSTRRSDIQSHIIHSHRKTSIVQVRGECGDHIYCSRWVSYITATPT
jgi:hypothetical protein